VLFFSVLFIVLRELFYLVLSSFIALLHYFDFSENNACIEAKQYLDAVLHCDVY